MVEYVGPGGREALRGDLTEIARAGHRPDFRGIALTPVEEFYPALTGSTTVDAEAAACRRVAAVEQALAAGYTGVRTVIDATAAARTPTQRATLARWEYLFDQQTVALPVSALCGYDINQLGTAATELVCLHPLISPHDATFRLYAAPDADFTLTGAIDFSNAELFDTTLHRVRPGALAGDLLVDARELAFIDHRGLLALERYARATGREVVLRSNLPVLTRLARLDLDRLRVQRASVR